MASHWGRVISKNRDTQYSKMLISSFLFLFLPFSFLPFLPQILWPPTRQVLLKILETTVMNQRDRFLTSWGLQFNMHCERHTECRNNSPCLSFTWKKKDSKCLRCLIFCFWDPWLLVRIGTGISVQGRKDLPSPYSNLTFPTSLAILFYSDNPERGLSLLPRINLFRWMSPCRIIYLPFQFILQTWLSSKTQWFIRVSI